MAPHNDTISRRSFLRRTSAGVSGLLIASSLPLPLKGAEKSGSAEGTDRKNESCMTLSDLRSDSFSTTNEMLVSEAPCAQAITLMPFLPIVPNSLPAMPGGNGGGRPDSATAGGKDASGLDAAVEKVIELAGL